MADRPPTAEPSPSSSASPPASGGCAAVSSTAAAPEADGGGAADGCLFDAILTPHRSLSPAGFLLLMSLVALAGFGIGIAFLTVGAWPVFGFCGLEVFLIWLCFRVSYRSARMWERIRLTPAALVVERHMVDGAWREWTFQPYWLRVLMDDPPQHESRLVLTSHGESVAVGGFLTPDERLDLAKALRRALAAARETPTG